MASAISIFFHTIATMARRSLAGLLLLRKMQRELLMLLSVSLLFGVAAYGIIRERFELMERARQDALNLAQTLQIQVSGQLDRVSYSLLGVRKDLQETGHTSDSLLKRSLSQAMRYDPVSAFLGFSDGNEVTMIDRAGNVLDAPVLANAMKSTLQNRRPATIEVLRLTYDETNGTGYLPLVLGVQRTDGHSGVVFSLVPIDRLAEASPALRLIADGRFGILTRDGVRLFSYMGREGAFVFSSAPVPAAFWKRITADTKGTFEGESSVDNRYNIFGFSWSESLPIVVMSGIQRDSLNATWLKRSAIQLFLLLLATLAVTILAFRLRGAAAELARSHRLYRESFSSVRDGLVLLNRDGIVQKSNPGASRILRTESEQALVGINLFDLSASGSSTDGARRGPDYLRHLSPGEARTEDWTFQRGDQTGVVDVRMQLCAFSGGEQTLVTALLQDVTEEREYLQKQEFLAQHDALTGLLNRHGFLQQIDAMMKRHPDEPLFVALVDLNRFKEVNDSLGYDAGDTVLKTLSARLTLLLAGRSACLAKLGSDELAVCTLSAEWGGAIADLCHSLLFEVQQPFTVNDVRFEVTASIGVARYPDDARASAQLLRCADIATDAAKEAMVVYECYTPQYDRRTPQSLSLRSDFARAIREEGLTLAYQPKIRLSDQTLLGFEALSRWVHPTLGPISPAVFVPLAETAELVHTFTYQVIRGALKQLDIWHRAGADVSTSVNISANNLLSVDFVGRVRQLLEEFGTPPERLEFEVTESALMRDPDAALERLHMLRDLGVKLSIDDFGTGYSSLTYLKKLPVDLLKIDQSFIASVLTDDADRKIVEWSIQLAHSFGMQVVAEGVETAESAALLKAAGCDIAQGYFYGRPTTAEIVEQRWLVRGIER